MKGLDTSVLLGLLEGDPTVRGLVKRFHGVELATTEVNLLELTLLAGRAGRPGRTPRRHALERLRRKLTVLPIDSRAIDQVGRRVGRETDRLAPHVLAMLAAFEAGGCDEIFSRDLDLSPGTWKPRVSRIAKTQTK